MGEVITINEGSVIILLSTGVGVPAFLYYDLFLHGDQHNSPIFNSVVCGETVVYGDINADLWSIYQCGSLWFQLVW